MAATSWSEKGRSETSNKAKIEVLSPAPRGVGLFRQRAKTARHGLPGELLDVGAFRCILSSLPLLHTEGATTSISGANVVTGVPKMVARRTKIAKPSETSSASGEAHDTSSVARSQEAVLMGQQALQALVAKSTNASSSSITNSHPASSTLQAAPGLPPRRPGGEGQVDIGSMLSSVLNSPVFGNLMSNVAAQTGLESPSDVRNIMEDLTHNPAVMDTLSNMVQSVDGPRRGQGGGFDLSRMMQQMMPVVNQVLGGVTARPADTETGDSRLQPRQTDREVRDAVDGISSEIDLHEVCERIEQCDAPEDIFGVVLETAAQAYGEDESIQFMLEEIASDPELADDYLKLLLEQVGERVESESETRRQS